LIGDLAAWKNEDLKTLTAFELFYDAVATAAMNHLRLPVQKYALVLQQMIAYIRGNGTDRKRHPDLEQRQSLIRTGPPLNLLAHACLWRNRTSRRGFGCVLWGFSIQFAEGCFI
jgi:hypothetical protein